MPHSERNIRTSRQHSEACLRIYKLSPEDTHVIYFYALTINGKDYATDNQFSRNLLQQRNVILNHIREFTSYCLGDHSSDTIDNSLHTDESKANLLASLYNNEHTPLEVLRGSIGNYIYHGLGMETVFDALIDGVNKHGITSLQILTDDFEIPWEWVSRDGQKMLCEMMDVGKLYPKHIETYDEKEKDQKELLTVKDDEDLKKLKEASRVLLVFDDMAKCDGWTPLPRVKEEIDRIRDCFLRNDFIRKNIRLINGQDEGECLDLTLKQELHTNSQIKVIHLSGHIDSDGSFLHQDGRLTPGELHRLPQAKARLHESKPFIFLNGCSSGSSNNVYNESSQLSTMFACLGASACLTTVGPIRDVEASYFSQEFYNILLDSKNKGKTIGEVLRMAREKFTEEFPGRPDAYFYSIIGKADFVLFPVHSKELMLEKRAPEPVINELNRSPDTSGSPFGI